MDIFKTLSTVMAPGTQVVITVLPAKDGRLTVLTHVDVPGLEDPAAKLIPDFMVKGTPEDLDKEYAGLITEPLKQSTDLQTNMKEVEEGIKEAAKKRKKAEDDKNAEAAKKKAADDTAFDDLAKAAEEAFKKGDWKTAVQKYEAASAKADEVKASYKFSSVMKKNLETAQKKVKEASMAPSMFDFDALDQQNAAAAAAEPEDMPEDETREPEDLETEEEAA